MSKERNWIEDYAHENGNYNNICCICNREFIGHKRRVVCKVCASKEKLTVESVEDTIGEWWYDYCYSKNNTEGSAEVGEKARLLIKDLIKQIRDEVQKESECFGDSRDWTNAVPISKVYSIFNKYIGDSNE